MARASWRCRAQHRVFVPRFHAAGERQAMCHKGAVSKRHDLRKCSLADLGCETPMESGFYDQDEASECRSLAVDRLGSELGRRAAGSFTLERAGPASGISRSFVFPVLHLATALPAGERPLTG